MPQVLSYSRFRNNRIELTKRKIQKYKTTENRILNSNKNNVEKTEILKTLGELQFIISYVLSAAQ